MHRLALLAVSGLALGLAQDDSCHSAHADRASCEADSKCTWCTCAAVPSSCFTKENAARLPPAVFQCGKPDLPQPRYRSELLSRQVQQAMGIAWRGNSSTSRSHQNPAPARRRSELLSREVQQAMGIAWRGNASDSHDRLLAEEPLPADFSWCNKDGVNYCTISKNQHIPQYCGSCWAHGALSALSDRLKIARKAQGVDVTLSVQHLLNCGGVGTCKGGSVDGPYQWLLSISKQGSGLSYETAQPYLACTPDSDEGFCPHVDTSCRPINVARTCGGFSAEGGPCTGLSSYPNATISDYGSISGAEAMMKEIYLRGPIACGIDAMPLLNYESGIIKTQGDSVDHVISVVGWGTDSKEGPYWIIRNSWGEYWGEMGYVRVARGALLVEDQCSWAVPSEYTALEKNNQVHCHEGGDNCKSAAYSEFAI